MCAQRVPFPGQANASLRPILPKHTQLQNSTLAIQVETAMLSGLTSPCGGIELVEFGPKPAGGITIAGEGTMSGLTANKTAVPVIPTTVDSKKPALERSTRYHSTGLTSARVSETCKVDCHGSLRYSNISEVIPEVDTGYRTMANAIPMKAPMLLTTEFQSASKLLLGLDLCFSSSLSRISSDFSSCSLLISCLPPAGFLPMTSSQKTSTQGNKVPNATPAMPQNIR